MTADFPNRVVSGAVAHAAALAPDGKLITACGYDGPGAVTCPKCAAQMRRDDQPEPPPPTGRMRAQDVPQDIVMTAIQAHGDVGWDAARRALAAVLPEWERRVRVAIASEIAGHPNHIRNPQH